ncbi:MAG: UTP--glucose-1-phosphate uridylyltransferase [Candidatus Cloacimonadota bacterium]|nr:MAG: UTP--glucose-1-phosphate uridylyltransferase [Candidatus Cloacimonadota bacterium]
MNNHLNEFVQIMAREGLHKTVIDSFAFYYRKLIEGEKGKLSEKEIAPPHHSNLINYEEISRKNTSLLEKLVVVKLNGGLGTSMGLKKAKSLLRVKKDLNFLDIIARQILFVREQTNIDIPLLFMHSFNTRDDSLSYLKKYPELKLPEFPLDFLQNKFPRIKEADFSPYKNKDEKKNWNPPGHGEIYLVMQISGILEKLLDAGKEYVFISNSDNLGAVVDEKIITFIEENQIPFLMEVCRRTESDKKGGHLAQTKTGRLILREVAQCPEDEVEQFQNIDKYKYFNTNNLWVNLKALKRKLAENNNFLPLSLIVNPKTVDGEKVIQLETAMGAAISIFDGAKALIVGRDRFTPVKKTNDLLAVWSDAYELLPNYKLALIKELSEPPEIILDERYYKTIEQLEEHFAEGVPSLKKCSRLEITADVYFGKNVILKGNVKIDRSGKIENTEL